MSDDDVKVAKSGKPFASEDEARKALAGQELAADVWGVSVCDGGYRLEKHVARLQRMERTRNEQAAEAMRLAEAAEKYHWIEFPGRSDREPEFVELSWQGDRLTCRREVRLPLPQRYLGVCDNALQKVYEPTRRSSTPFKEAGFIRRRPYRVLGDATKADFEAFMRDGNDITRKAVLAESGRVAAEGGA